jgi:hypothetical protein
MQGRIHKVGLLCGESFTKATNNGATKPLSTICATKGFLHPYHIWNWKTFAVSLACCPRKKLTTPLYAGNLDLCEIVPNTGMVGQGGFSLG